MIDDETAVSAPTSKGVARRQTIIDAAAAIIHESGPASVTHRAVAKRAGCSLSATTYYFNGLDDLLYHAGLVNIRKWARRAERVAEQAEALQSRPDLDGCIELILAATLPSEGPYLGHYIQLISAGGTAPVGRAYREGRQQLNAAVDRLIATLGIPATAEVIIGVVDGAAVTALSEQRDVRQTAASLLRRLALQSAILPQRPQEQTDPELVRVELRRQVPLPPSLAHT
ncbi:putative DNA-binding transcriptional regulator [Actinomyces bovis]|uniref:DNA-binding transcriptional regulator n=1 Tax=Actinomyces bovis TaxID=1658 RepID=A0ABY1VRG6_9ACTO|nr:TetR family transcriptional regulator [Actinomyces bovis]SPT54272.1 putative DNA-binding transcriptional regulator [Actinomyces bovis]VEG56410.1 putative DNA-binding transcriptional regulator [Actinomyces israelii]